MSSITRQEWFYAACGVIACVFFAYFDLQIRGVVNVPIAYVSLLGLGLLARSQRLILLLGLLGVLATLLCYLLIPELVGVADDLTNRQLVILAIITITVTSHIYMRRQVEFEITVARMANTDALTGIANRRALMDELERRINESKRHNNPLSLILFDIDDFKTINDRFGHLAGDDILQRLTRVCQKWLRTSDLIGRYGGEEFLIICPNTPTEGARILAERIREAIEATDFFYKTHSLRVTISCGITKLENHLRGPSEMQNETELAHDMIDAADSAMYHAKQSGKNTVFAFEMEGEEKFLQKDAS